MTAVGGTTWGKDGDANGDALDDTAWSHSGGGFTPSKYFTGIADAPWQAAAVAAYLNGTAGVKLPPSWQWDAKGRGLPDVSAIAVDYDVVINGGTSGVSGTSASAPAFAGYVSVLNDARLRAGKKPMGFLNPWLYANPGAFRDITKGTNDNAGALHLLPGFKAAPGWDPATGLGVPDLQKMLEAAMAAAGGAAPRDVLAMPGGVAAGGRRVGPAAVAL